MAKTKPSRRRDVVRHPRSSRGAAFWRRTREYSWALLFVVVLTLGGSLIAMSAESRARRQVGEINTAPVVARVDFSAIDQQQTRQRQIDARDREPARYSANMPFYNRLREKLLALGEPDADGAVKGVNFKLAPEDMAQLEAHHQDPAAEAWPKLVDKFLEQLFRLAIIEAHRAEIERDDAQRAAKIIIGHPAAGDLERYDNDLLSLKDDLARTRSRIAPLAQSFPDRLRKPVLDVAMQDLEATYRYDSEATERERNARFASEPPVEVHKRAGDVLIPAGKIVDTLDDQLLRDERKAYVAALGPMKLWLGRLAEAAMIGMMSLLLWGYVVAYQPRIARKPLRGLALTSLLLLTQLIAVAGTFARPEFIWFTGVFPTLLVAIVLAIAYDHRFAIGGGLLHGMLVLTSLDLSVYFGLLILAGVAVAVGQLNEIRTRSKLVWVGFGTGLVLCAIAPMTVILERPLHIPGLFDAASFAALLALGTGIVTGMLVQGILPAIENVFKVTTSMTLKELNDASHPLLRRLAQDAPGTYRHSLAIADMAEAAALVIGSESLLCRVGAMYHDIGKINKPHYFVENQAGGPNRHNKLSPAMSLLIIVGHVKDGIELAREYNLPPSLIQFIESHHGTTLVEYFYHAARKRSEEADEAAPTEFEYRYPGPKPQTKEAAILMLCDGIEGAARTLPEPNPTRIEQLVHAIANKRLMDGQFEECNLTLHELHKIEESIIKTLNAIYHGRVKYPTQLLPPPATQPPTTTPEGGNVRDDEQPPAPPQPRTAAS